METSTGPARVLVVDDEPSVADVVARSLRVDGLDVTVVGTGWQALDQLRRSAFDLVVLDIGLADDDGIEVCQRLRGEGFAVPVLFLTARADPADAVAALRSGGDDYIRKPFDVDELRARAASVLRRAAHGTEPSALLTIGDLRIDCDAQRAHRAGVPLDLTLTELRMLEVLMRNPRRVLTKAQLLDLVWDDPDAVGLATVETVVSRLRRKLEALGDPVIETRRGVGYGLFAGGP